MTQQSCLSGEGWPLWRISLTFSLIRRTVIGYVFPPLAVLPTWHTSMIVCSTTLHPQVTKDIASLVLAAGDCIDVIVPQSQLQEGTDNCGLFAIATATSLCFGIPPSTVLWNQKKMREHLRRCFESGKMSPFPGWDLPDRRKITPHISDEPLG